ncbi:MAG: hypothetical protein AAB581_03310 [Patescibacteria group bacterium]
MRQVGFVTYNSVGDGVADGWHKAEDRQAYVLQNSKGERFAVDGVNGGEFETLFELFEGKFNRADGKYADGVSDEINAIWRKLQAVVNDLDHLVVYVGSAGSERAIELARQLPASKVTFVGCDCGLPFKEALIQKAGLTKAGRVLCECGGRRTMKAIFDRFMKTGALLPANA